MKWNAYKYSIEKEVRLSREEVWELLSDTDHLNRLIGLFPVKFGPAVGVNTTKNSLKALSLKVLECNIGIK